MSNSLCLISKCDEIIFLKNGKIICMKENKNDENLAHFVKGFLSNFQKPIGALVIC